jgi:DHA1 family bicyclomycin/chloramphenicol resistance-like MFS transporter
LFEGEAARAKRAYVTVVFGAAPVLGPALGSLLISIGGWRAVFVVMAIMGGMLLLAAQTGLAESHRPGVAEVRPAPAVRLRDDAPFLGFVLTNALSYGAIFAYITGAPIVIIGEMKLSSASFSGIFACTALALTAGAWTSGRLGRRRYTAPAMLGPSLAIAASAALGLAAISLTGPVWHGVLLLPPLLVIFFTRGTIAPNLQHVAIERRRDHAGTAAAILGVSQLASGALASAVVAILLPAFGVQAVALPMLLLAAAALAAWHWTSRPGRKAQRLPGVLPI